MPYEYRQLSPHEREEIVRRRHAMGFPLHAPPHPFRDAGYYLITAANFEHAPVMNTPNRRTEFDRLLVCAMREIQAELICWAILPNHYHALIDVDSLDSVSAILKHLHGMTSRRWNIEDSLTGKRRVWYKFFDRRIKSESQLHQTFNYVHYNPVKHGFVEDAYGWPWSSLPLYYESNGQEWLGERWKSNPPPETFGRGWDD